MGRSMRLCTGVLPCARATIEEHFGLQSASAASEHRKASSSRIESHARFVEPTDNRRFGSSLAVGTHAGGGRQGLRLRVRWGAGSSRARRDSRVEGPERRPGGPRATSWWALIVRPLMLLCFINETGPLGCTKKSNVRTYVIPKIQQKATAWG